MSLPLLARPNAPGNPSPLALPPSAGKCPFGKAWVDGSDSNPHSYVECSNKVSATGAQRSAQVFEATP